MNDEAAFWVGPTDRPDTYRLVSMIGDGGEGEVWEAILPLSDSGRHRVALKILPGGHDPAEEAAWLHNGHLLRSLADPGLVRVTDHFVGARKHRAGRVAPVENGAAGAVPATTGSNGAPAGGTGDETRMHGDLPFRYVVMDLVEGTTFRDWIDAHPEATARQRLRPLAMVAGALDAMHSGEQTEVPVAHGDVKPSNIVVKPDGATLLVDLGLTRLTDGPGGHGSSLPYAAPELLRTGQSSVEADRFAFYATVVHALTGEVPAVGQDGRVDLATLERRLHEAPATRGRPELIGSVLGALAAPPSHRPGPLRPWLSSLTETLTGSVTGTRPASIPVESYQPPGGPRKRSRAPLVVAAVVLLLLLVGGGAALALGGGGGPKPIATPAPVLSSSSPSPTDAPSPTDTPTTDVSSTPAVENGALPEGAVYLDEQIKVDQSTDGSSEFKPYDVSGATYGHGVGLSLGCTDSSGDIWVDFNLSRRYATLHTTVGLSDNSPSNGHTTYKVIGDGRTLASGDLRLGAAQQVNVPVAGVLRVRLFVNDPTRSDIVSCPDNITTVFGDPSAAP